MIVDGSIDGNIVITRKKLPPVNYNFHVITSGKLRLANYRPFTALCNFDLRLAAWFL